MSRGLCRVSARFGVFKDRGTEEGGTGTSKCHPYPKPPAKNGFLTAGTPPQKNSWGFPKSAVRFEAPFPTDHCALWSFLLLEATTCRVQGWRV